MPEGWWAKGSHGPGSQGLLQTPRISWCSRYFFSQFCTEMVFMMSQWMVWLIPAVNVLILGEKRSNEARDKHGKGLPMLHGCNKNKFPRAPDRQG